MQDKSEDKGKTEDEEDDRSGEDIISYKMEDMAPQPQPEEELKELYNDAMEISLVSQDGKIEGNAYIEFPREVDDEKAFEEKQGTEING
ncbi:hypothetical protein A6R68_11041 [Neotoma lepida]|uniref:RRM domain-containing protein n=1 Tax=Neotoma lepida TaxID=56216 RepID=A0A1A6FV49_NEOLE|nr:hypothetical protein A6R68_11041 [Neotoma lepida]